MKPSDNPWGSRHREDSEHLKFPWSPPRALCTAQYRTGVRVWGGAGRLFLAVLNINRDNVPNNYLGHLANCIIIIKNNSVGKKRHKLHTIIDTIIWYVL